MQKLCAILVNLANVVDLEIGKKLTHRKLIIAGFMVRFGHLAVVLPVPCSDEGLHFAVLELIELLQGFLVSVENITESAEHPVRSGVQFFDEPSLKLRVLAGIGEGDHDLVTVRALPGRKLDKILVRDGFVAGV